MCGIAGVFRFSDPSRGGVDDRNVVASMLEELRLRGPDAEDLLVQPPITLGHRRLAILDLSDAGRQPMASRDGRFVVSYNGEIYNFADVREELGLQSSDLRSATDTEILLEAWQRWGEGCLSHLVGQFAFAMYDRLERRMFLVRDRVGEKPLYYHRDSGKISFASSIAALFKAPWVGRELNQESLGEYLTLRYVVAPNTIVQGIEKLRPGHLMELDETGAATTRRWWTPPLVGEPTQVANMERAEAVEQFGVLFRQAVKRCLVSDVPVGLLLSDGIDSNALRHILQETGATTSTHTFRVSSSREEAKSLASSEDQDDSVEVCSFDPRGVYEHLEPALSCLTEPVGDGASIAIWLLIRAARASSTVFLCGHGGDEVLGGYRLSQEWFRLALARYASKLPLFLAASAVEYWTHGAEPLAQRHRAFGGANGRTWPAAVPYLIHRPLYFKDLQELRGGAAGATDHLSAIHRLYAECSAGKTDLDQIQYVLLETFFAANILSFADSVAMDSSAELRMPFVDRDLMEFSLRLPRKFKAGRLPGGANTKRILRYWAQGRVPEKILARRKRSFRYGSIRRLLEGHGPEIRSRILDLDVLRQSLPGLEAWIGQDPEVFRGPREGSLWALLSLAFWGHGVGLR